MPKYGLRRNGGGPVRSSNKLLRSFFEVLKVTRKSMSVVSFRYPLESKTELIARAMRRSTIGLVQHVDMQNVPHANRLHSYCIEGTYRSRSARNQSRLVRYIR